MHRAWLRFFALTTGCTLWLATPASAQPRLADRLLPAVGQGDAGWFVHPRITQSHFRFVVALLARSARVPIGFEEVAAEPQEFEGNLAMVPLEERKSLIGLTVGRALDLLVAADPRYAWREQDGVLLLRPVAAWRDREHYLQAPVPGLEADRRRAIDIAKNLYERQGIRIIWSSGGVIGGPSHFEHDLGRLISVSLGPGTLLDALNAIVKAHGGLGWLIRVRQGPRRTPK